jgi:hypothetical protein
MSQDNNENRLKNQINNIERHCSKLQEKALTKEEHPEPENMLILLRSLLEGVSKQLSTPAFSYWFSDFSIQELYIDHIIFGTDTQLKMEWLEARYSNLIFGTLKSITGTVYKLGFVVVPKKKYDA